MIKLDCFDIFAKVHIEYIMHCAMCNKIKLLIKLVILEEKILRYTELGI